MKRTLLFSLAAHLVFLVGLALIPGRPIAPAEYLKVYRVKLLRAKDVPAPARARVSRRGAPAMKETRSAPAKSTPRRRPTRTLPDRRPPAEKRPTKETSDAVDAPAQRSVVTPSTIRLDAESFPFPEYLQALVDTMQAKWRLPSGIGGAGRATVYFRILRHGSIRRPVVEVGSGARAFDRSVLDAVLRSDPFSPLPEGFQGEYLGIHFSFERE